MAVNSSLSTTMEELARARQGIRNPRVVMLSAGDVLFRFASTRNMQSGASIPSSDWARGAWWVQERDYRTIIDRFQKGNLSLGTVGRSAVAVQPSWSNMDVSIKAYLLDDMYVYVGNGSTQYRDQLPNGMYVTLAGWPDIDQVYIPKMRGPASRNLRVLRQKVVTTDQFGF